jgi:hypothetical protein
MVAGILLEILAKIRPSTTDAHHDALAVLSNTADEELDGSLTS